MKWIPILLVVACAESEYYADHVVVIRAVIVDHEGAPVDHAKLWTVPTRKWATPEWIDRVVESGANYEATGPRGPMTYGVSDSSGKITVQLRVRYYERGTPPPYKGVHYVWVNGEFFDSRKYGSWKLSEAQGVWAELDLGKIRLSEKTN